MRYFEGAWKYRLAEDLVFETGIQSELGAVLPFCEISPSGRLLVQDGYSWDGASGPAIDTKTIMRAACIHDALYQLLRETVFGYKANHDTRRRKSDLILRKVCLEDGMWRSRAWWVYRAVRRAGGPAAAIKKRRVYQV